MRRNIQQLRGASPPVNQPAFHAAVDKIAAATQRLLDELAVGATSKPAVPLQRRREGDQNPA